MRTLVSHRLAVFALICGSLVNGCQTLEGILESSPKPTARIIGTELKNLSLERIDLVFNVEVANPYAVDLPLLDLTYTVGSRGTSVIQLHARITFASLIRTLKGVRPGSVVPYKADLTLGVDAPVVGRLV